jgi:hypothetical protein
MALIQIEFERSLALHAHRLAQCLGCDEGIAVAVAADPAADAQEGRQLKAVLGESARRQLVFQRGIEARQLAQKSVVVIGKPVGDLVDDFQPGLPQHAGLPQREHGAAQGLFICPRLFRREPGAIAFRQQLRHLHLAVDHAFAPHLGRVRGEHRTDDGVGEKAL